MVERGLNAARDSFKEAGKEPQFEVLMPWLIRDAAGLSQADAAAELDMSTWAIKVAVHRLRQKFGEAIRQEIVETVDTGEEIAEQLRYLIKALQVR